MWYRNWYKSTYIYGTFRRLYRQMLFVCPGNEKYLSAAILDPETIYQKVPSVKSVNFGAERIPAHQIGELRQITLHSAGLLGN